MRRYSHEKFLTPSLRILSFYQRESSSTDVVLPIISALFHAPSLALIVKSFWQHTGTGISSRRAEFCLAALDSGSLVATHLDPATIHKGPARYNRRSRDAVIHKTQQRPPCEAYSSSFLEERFGRNLNIRSCSEATKAIKRRIVDGLNYYGNFSIIDRSVNHQLNEQDVFLFPCGMNAIFSIYQTLIEWRRGIQSIMFG